MFFLFLKNLNYWLFLFQGQIRFHHFLSPFLGFFVPLPWEPRAPSLAVMKMPACQSGSSQRAHRPPQRPGLSFPTPASPEASPGCLPCLPHGIPVLSSPLGPPTLESSRGPDWQPLTQALSSPESFLHRACPVTLPPPPSLPPYHLHPSSTRLPESSLMF